jgi:hypothetical protein
MLFGALAVKAARSCVSSLLLAWPASLAGPTGGTRLLLYAQLSTTSTVIFAAPSLASVGGSRALIALTKLTAAQENIITDSASLLSPRRTTDVSMSGTSGADAALGNDVFNR